MGVVLFNEEHHTYTLYSADEIKELQPVTTLLKCHRVKIRAEIKTSAVLDIEGCRWQLSLYDFLDTEDADKFMVFHFNKGKLKVVPVIPLELRHIEALLVCGDTGWTYSEYTNLPD